MTEQTKPATPRIIDWEAIEAALDQDRIELLKDSRDCADLVLTAKAFVAALPGGMSERFAGLLREMEDITRPLTNDELASVHLKAI